MISSHEIPTMFLPSDTISLHEKSKHMTLCNFSSDEHYATNVKYRASSSSSSYLFHGYPKTKLTTIKQQNSIKKIVRNKKYKK